MILGKTIGSSFSGDKIPLMGPRLNTSVSYEWKNAD